MMKKQNFKKITKDSEKNYYQKRKIKKNEKKEKRKYKIEIKIQFKNTIIRSENFE